ncbi:putative chromo domain-containing protein LHP1 [Iris pallida]|uniref:Chromo domain-containing protein LHP1 n=1 Tax=Iris pallida TaxID=29817 RepID=A0AAX6GDX1_IRIPA|nr:putative chromo domain-containing protein LHP1 [Iris pallida]
MDTSPPSPPVDNDGIGVLGKGGEEKEGNTSNDEIADDAGDATGATKEASDPPPVEANGPVQEAAATAVCDAAVESIFVQLNGVGEPDGSSGSQEEENPPKAPKGGAQAPVLLGAKKRKVGNLRRFKQESATNQEEADSTEEDNIKRELRDPPLITKIIMPGEYCATETDNVQ